MRLFNIEIVLPIGRIKLSFCSNLRVFRFFSVQFAISIIKGGKWYPLHVSI